MKTNDFISVLKGAFTPNQEIAFGILLENGDVYPIKDCSITETGNGKTLTFNRSNNTLALITMAVISKAK